MRSKVNLSARKQRLTGSYALLSALVISQGMPLASLAAGESNTGTPPSTPVPGGASAIASDLSVAAGATQILNISDSQSFNLTGNLTNNGTIYVVSTNPQVQTATLSAQNFFNGPGALITTVLPAGGLPNYSNAIPNLSLMLVAVNDIVNHGTISSAGSLSAVAGGSIVNTTAMSATAAALPAVMQAVANLNLNASSIINSGVLNSINSNVNLNTSQAALAAVQQSLNLSSVVPQNMNINNTSGLIQALNGSVNFGSSSLAKESILTVLGGSVDSPVINIDGGAGAVDALFESLSGVVNVQACTAHIGAAGSGVLNLGSINIAGDPTFYNSGDIFITGNVLVGEALAIVSTGSVIATGAFNISTVSGGVGHDVFIVAGAGVLPNLLPTSPTLPPLTNQLVGIQTLQVNGGSTNGGSIVLSGSTINAGSTVGNNAGGNVSLVAFAGPGGGGISDVMINTGGSGTGANGNVQVMAGGNLLLTTTAISNVGVQITGGASSLQMSDVKIQAATPVGAVLFFSNGIAAGAFSPLVLTDKDINLASPILTQGGDVLIETKGAFANTVPGTINTSGGIAGRGGGDITINAGSILVRGALDSSGAAGATGLAGIFGLGGGAGQAGGSGGGINLTAGKLGLTIDANITASGGSGGTGGKGGDGFLAQVNGGAGGMGGLGAGAGRIALKTTDSFITQTVTSLITSRGGSGGAGGQGGAGGPAGPFFAGSGGAGGNAGPSSGGGLFDADSGTGALTLGGFIDLLGGAGGAGGQGGDGASDVNKLVLGGNGGFSGVASGGSGGGSVSMRTSSGNMFVNTLFAPGGIGGAAAASGNGGDGSFAGSGGIVNSAGGGGLGGGLLAQSQTGDFTFTGLATLNGGVGGSINVNSGGGGNGSITGGSGGAILNAGGGGGGGSFSVNTKGALLLSGNIDALGGAGGNINATAGSGGTGALLGGSGGGLGASGGGAPGGRVDLTSMNSSVSQSGIIRADGGAGGNLVGFAGSGGAGTGLVSFGGQGGAVGASGGGAGSGSVSLSAGTGILSRNLSAKGGAGGLLSANAGNGGDAGALGIAGFGGGLLPAGGGAAGGTVKLTSTKGAISVSDINVSGGNGGDITGQGGNGGSGFVGADGGMVLGSGAGGTGGGITIQTSQMAADLGAVTVDVGSVIAMGGASGFYSAQGGRGGDGKTYFGGAGGSVGSQGNGGGGGQILVSGLSLTVTSTGLISVNGGSTTTDPRTVKVGFAGISGAGGNGGLLGFGGNGGRVGDAGSGGGGGLIFITMPGTVDVTSNINGGDAISARGGTVADFTARSGKGGNGGTSPITFGLNGGNGGDIGSNGSGGNGGNIFILGNSGTIGGIGVVVAAGGQVGRLSTLLDPYQGMAAISGAGGNGGPNGAGGRSGGILNNGAGGRGGNIFVTTVSGDINLSPLITAGGDVNAIFRPTTGVGGTGGSITGSGGSSGSIGSNGDAGPGGLIFVSSVFGNLKPLGTGDPQVPSNMVTYLAPGGAVIGAQAITGAGGTATFGNGGTSGDIGTTGSGGHGGNIFMSTFSGEIKTPKGVLLATGGDAGKSNSRTGDGGMTNFGIGGDSGLIGGNGGGGTAGFVYVGSILGDVGTYGPIVARGGVANGNTSVTGKGGDSLNGNAGSSGMIKNGGDGGAAGTIFVIGKTITMGEAWVASGGNAAASPYAPRTGDGGNGTAKGGGSGQILSAGTAGKGGTIYGQTLFGNFITPDHMNVDGGRAGDTPFLPFHDGGPGAMEGVTGKGGNGASGGDAGVVGNAPNGYDAGTITVVSAGSIFKAVEFKADGGNGGAQLGIGGKGGNGSATQGGDGGKVLDAGKGGNGGSITLTASLGPSNTKVSQAIGGNGGANAGQGGDGGTGGINGTKNHAGGDGGSVGDSGVGGNGGSYSLTIKPSLFGDGSAAFTGNAPAVPGEALNLYGGAGGAYTGKSGTGGNSTGSILSGGIGGAGGDLGKAGGGGFGGSLNIDIPGALQFDIPVNANGGNSGSYLATAGDGGSGSLGLAAGTSMKGGHGGTVGDQGFAGNGGKIGAIGIKAASLVVSPGVELTANGGDASFYSVTAGKGGAGGGAGGVGGDAGSAGSAGKGGLVNVTTSGQITINGALKVNGGNRNAVTATGGDGGDAGLGGGVGGDAGMVKDIGTGGTGGKISLTSNFGGIDGLGVLELNGGSVLPTTLKGGKGGKGFTNGDGGVGGKVGTQGDAGSGGGLTNGGGATLYALGAITIQGYSANGGRVFGPYGAQGGDGGDAGSLQGVGGVGGKVLSSGGGGAGGTFSFTSLVGDISLGQINALGGDSAAMGGKGGKGGNQLTGDASGKGTAAGGDVGKNGDGGGGGSVTVLTAGNILINGDWSLSGGSVGAKSSVGGDGGLATGTAGMGGDAGDAGDQGSGGKGGTVTIYGLIGDVSIKGNITANGGSILGDYTGKGGTGGAGKEGGGGGGGAGDNGRSGGGGEVKVFSFLFSKITTDPGKIIQANAGAVSEHHGIAGAGGDGGAGRDGQAAGKGGGVGNAADGGGGGKITLFSPFGGIKLGGDISANGVAGGLQAGQGGKGGNGNPKGLDGGQVGKSGEGGAGGEIRLVSFLGKLDATGIAISANGGDGGTQSGKAGNGGNGDPQKAGMGGNVLISGNGGAGGTVQVFGGTGTLPPVIMPSILNGGPGPIVGAQFGLGGLPDGANGMIIGPGMPGAAGRIIRTPFVFNDPDLDNGLTGKNKNRRQIAAQRVSPLNGFAYSQVSGNPRALLIEPASRKEQSSLTDCVYANFVELPEDESATYNPVSLVQIVPNAKSVRGALAKMPAAASASLVLESKCNQAVSSRVAMTGAELLAGDSGNFKLKEGELLFAPQEQITIELPQGTLKLAAGTKVLVEAGQHTTVVRTLHDRKESDVVFRSGKSTSKIGVGRQLIISDQQDARAKNSIATRGAQSIDLPGGLTLSHSEFSLVSAIANHPVLKALKSSENRSERTHMDPIVKNAVILTYLTIKRGPFHE